MEKTESAGEGREKLEKGTVHSSHDSAPSLIVVGTETAVFDRGSRVRERILSYGRFFREVTIVVLCSGSFKQEVAGNVTLVPTNSKTRISRLLHGVALGTSLPDADIVTVQDPFETGIVGYFIARKKNAALHVQVHTDFLAPAYVQHSALNKLRRWIAGFVLRRAARVRVVSARIRESITPGFNLGMPVTVLPIFVDLERFKSASADGVLSSRFATYKTKLLVVSRLEPEKNVELAIRSLYDVSSRSRDVCLIVVGDGSARKRLEALSRSLNISDRVFFEGAQDPAPYYKLSDAVLFPSKYDGYGLVIVEALAAGKPVLSTDVGVAREAGAIVTSEKDFARDLAKWLESGPREGRLLEYPYKNFDEYVAAYCADIAACTKDKKSI